MPISNEILAIFAYAERTNLCCLSLVVISTKARTHWSVPVLFVVQSIDGNVFPLRSFLVRDMVQRSHLFFLA